jgi:hypothetical protein
VVGETVKIVEAHGGLDVRDASFQRVGPDLSGVEIRLNIAFKSKRDYFRFEQELDQRADCQLVSASSGT